MENLLKLKPAIHRLSDGRQELELVSLDDSSRKWTRAYEAGLALAFDADQLGLLERRVVQTDGSTTKRAYLKDVIELDEVTMQRYRFVAHTHGY
jgi:hypothetical protein